MARSTKRYALLASLVSASLSCSGSEAPNGLSELSSSALAAPEPVRFYAYECKAKLKPMAWFGMSPDERTLLTAGVIEPSELPEGAEPTETGLVDAWSLERGERQFTFHLGSAVVAVESLVVAFDPMSRYAFSPGGVDGSGQTAVAWDLAKGTTTRLGPSIAYPVMAKVSDDGRLVAMVGGTAELLTIDVDGMKILGRQDFAESHSVEVGFSKDGRVLIHRIGDLSLILRDPTSLGTIATFEGLSDVSQDGSLLATVSQSQAALFDANTGTKLRDLEITSDLSDVLSVSFSPDARVVGLVVNATLIVFDVSTGKRLAEVNAPTAHTVEWTPDGQALLTGWTLWNTKTWTATEIAGPISMRPGQGHLFDRFEGDSLIETDALTLKPTGRAYDLKGGGSAGGIPWYVFTKSGKHIVFHNGADNTIRLLRTSDHALLDLGVAIIDGVSHGFTATPEGSYDGPEAAIGCAPKTGRGRRVVPGLMKRFLAGEALN